MEAPECFIWIDLEMTGLNPDKDRIVEIATLVTDNKLNIIAEGPVLAIHQEQDVLDLMGDWVRKQHQKSGLTTRIIESTCSEQEAEAQTLDFLKQYVKAGSSPMCGNSICMDRRFLYRYMPDLEHYFHYRHLDVSTLKILAECWAPDVYKSLKKENQHLAMADIKDSIAELRHYWQYLIDQKFYKID